MTPNEYNTIISCYDKESSLSETLKKFSYSENIEIRKFVASNTKTPKDILSRLANDNEIDIRMCVAYNTNTPIDVIYYLANDKNVDVKRAVAGRHDLPLSVMAKLSTDEDTLVRSYIAEHTNSEELLDSLADDWDYLVTWGVATNENVNPRTLKKLVETKINPELFCSIAENKKANSKILELLFEKSTKPANDEVVQRIIRNPNITIDILDRIIEDDSFSIQTILMAIDERQTQKTLGKLSSEF